MQSDLNELGVYLADRLGTVLTGWQVVLNELTIEVERERLAEVIASLRDDSRCRFGCLIDICG
ncbi:MAG: NADH-quinone oxidoreductase subunit C, partial [Methyloceanibacter sp.]